jgi:hypothetical protein
LIDAYAPPVGAVAVGATGTSLPPVATGSGASGFAGGGGGLSAHATIAAGEIIAAPMITDRTTSLKGDRPLKFMA